MKRTFYVKALWDDEAKVYYAESDIIGLGIEAPDLETFEEVFNDVALELIMDNHIKPHDIINKALKDWLPTIIWQKPTQEKVAA